MKIRVQQSDMWVAMMQAMGANATPMPYAEVYTALKTGVVDAAENNWPSYESSRHYEAAKIYSLTEHSMAPELLVFSKKVWDGLSKEDQAIIRAAAKESVPYMRKLWDEREAQARKTVEAAGSQIVSDVDKKSFSDAMAPVYAKFAADPEAAGPGEAHPGGELGRLQCDATLVRSRARPRALTCARSHSSMCAPRTRASGRPGIGAASECGMRS